MESSIRGFAMPQEYDQDIQRLNELSHIFSVYVQVLCDSMNETMDPEVADAMMCIIDGFCFLIKNTGEFLAFVCEDDQHLTQKNNTLSNFHEQVVEVTNLPDLVLEFVKVYVVLQSDFAALETASCSLEMTHILNNVRIDSDSFEKLVNAIDKAINTLLFQCDSYNVHVDFFQNKTSERVEVYRHIQALLNIFPLKATSELFQYQVSDGEDVHSEDEALITVHEQGTNVEPPPVLTAIEMLTNTTSPVAVSSPSIFVVAPLPSTPSTPTTPTTPPHLLDSPMTPTHARGDTSVPMSPLVLNPEESKSEVAHVAHVAHTPAQVALGAVADAVGVILHSTLQSSGAVLHAAAAITAAFIDTVTNLKKRKREEYEQ